MSDDNKVEEDMAPDSEKASEPEPISFAEFLESTPPSSMTKISKISSRPDMIDYLLTPQIQLHCSSDACNGARFYRHAEETQQFFQGDGYQNFFLIYVCSNCRMRAKTYSIKAKVSDIDNSGTCIKYGEIPVFGPQTSSKLIKLIGEDRDIFLKGRRCENQGLGVGAFGYYRRVVENQKDRILDRVIEVSKKLAAPEVHIRTLEAAKNETQFSKSLKSVKDAIPQTLMINGHNPLTLLHSALSDGLHDRTDEHCLEIASSVRVVLGELSEKLAQAMKDEAEVKHALSKLMNIKKTTNPR